MATESKHDKITQKQMYWQTHIEQWSQTGLSQAAYCRKNNLKIKSFTYFKSRLNRKNLPVLVQIPIEQLQAPSFLKLNFGSNFQI